MERNTVNNLCVLPFNSLSVSAVGALRPCCNIYHYSYPANIATANLEEILNNPGATSLRESFIEDKRDGRCDRCWKMENLSNSSFRHIANNSIDRGIHTIDVSRLQSKITYDDIRYLDITLGNKCNLACRMCNETSSSLFARQTKTLGLYSGPVDIDFDRGTRDKMLDIIKKSKNLSCIYMLGGEPLVNDFHDEIIDLLISTGRSKDITLHYSTNLQIDVEKYLNLWNNFHIIELSVSIDGCDETYEYIRWPGTWNKLYKNLQRVVEFKKSQTRDLLYPSIATTVQNLNAHNLPALIERIRELDTDLSFYFIPISGSNYLELTPKHILEGSIAKLEKLSDKDGRIAELINYYKDALSMPIGRNKLAMFYAQQERFDSIRNQNLFETMPHFLDLKKEHNEQ